MKLSTILLSLLVLSGSAWAHGINGHIWVTDAGLAHLPACEDELQALFADPDLLEKYQFAASFPDSGYATDAGRAYGESAHWEPFVQAYVEHLQDKYAGNYGSPEAKVDLAFLFGLAQHGLQDETFDSIFVHRAEQVDGGGQDLIDTGTDFVIVEDGLSNLTPDPYFPEDVVDVFADIDVETDLRMLRQNTDIIRNVVIGLLELEDTDGLADDYRLEIPWAVEHFTDPDTPGSHAFERSLVAPYVQALWTRLHGRELGEQIILGAAPQSGRRLPSNDHTSVDSWFTVFFGMGLMNRDIHDGTVQVLDATGGPVDVEVHRVRWGSEDDTTRLVQIRPLHNWPHDASYTVVLDPAIARVDGQTLGAERMVSFRTACDEGKTCAALPEKSDDEGECVDISLEDQGGCSVAPSGQSRGVGLLLLVLPALLWRRWRN